MNFIKKNKTVILVLCLLSAAFATFRLFHITSLPIFTDEAIYIRWAQTGLRDPYYRFLSLTDGKQPLFIWIMYPFLKVFHDPLIAGRMVSVFSGFATMLGLGMVSFALFRKTSIALLTMAIYLVYPFAQVMDRMALYDSMVAMFFVWSLYISILLVRNLRLDIAYMLGFILGGGILTKTSNFLSIYLLPLTLLLFNFQEKHRNKRLIKWFGLVVLAILISQVMYGVLRLSPLPNVISQKNNNFYYPFSEWIHHPFMYVSGNIHGLIVPLFQYLTLPFVLLIIISLVYIRRDFKEKIMLLTFFLLPFVGFSFIAKEIFARYVFFMSMPLLLLAGWGLDFIQERIIFIKIKGSMRFTVSALVVFVFLSYPAYVSLAFAMNPISAPIANSDKGQYVRAWTSGWGLTEVVKFFNEQANNGPIYVATEGTFGLYPQGIELYLSENKNISIKGYYWEITKDFPKEVAEKAKTLPTYFVFYQPCPGGICMRPGDAPADWPVENVKEFSTQGTDTRVVIYRVKKTAAYETSN